MAVTASGEVGSSGHPKRPSVMTRLSAALHGEVSAETVEAFRGAGRQVYDDIAEADQLRQEILVDGTDLWTASPAQLSQLVCTWNAFALQSLGEAFIDADYQADPRTTGFLSRATAEQAAAFLGEVEHWSSQARQARADSGYSAFAHEHLPAPLPSWVRVEPCPLAHLVAMIAGGRVLHDRLQTALADFHSLSVPTDHSRDVSTMSGLAAEADSGLEYASRLHSESVTGRVHEAAEASLRRAVETYYRLGQLLAAPGLLAHGDPAYPAVPSTRLPLPDEAGFDPWVLTDPQSRSTWTSDPAARQAVTNLWRFDPDPALTLGIQSQIDAAASSGAIVAGATAAGRPLGNFYCCPWSAIYSVRQPVAINGERFRPGDQFTFDVSAEEVLTGGGFRRQLLRGPFHPTSEIDYCDPSERR